jgi:hypothetical protein
MARGGMRATSTRQTIAEGIERLANFRYTLAEWKVSDGDALQ